MAERPRVVNIHHEPYRSNPKLYVYVGRAGKGKDGTFGNPYDVRKHGKATLGLFYTYFTEKVWKDGAFYAKVVALAGKTLGCFCVQKDGTGPCHAKIIADFVAWQPEGVRLLALDASPLCPRCSCCGMTRETCEECEGEGGHNAENDALDLEPDEWVSCSACGSEGAWWRCCCDKEGKH